jgi:predicted dinucleotide-binding enzyme
MIDLTQLTIEPSVLKLISKRTALELTVLPLAVKNDVVILAVPPMFHSQVLTDVRVLLGNAKRIKPVSVSRDSIVAAIHRFYGASDS